MNETVMPSALASEEVEKQCLNLWLLSALSFSTQHPSTHPPLPTPTWQDKYRGT